jgi:hypothetical protein
MKKAGEKIIFPVDYHQYGRWNHLVRVTAWILRFIRFMKASSKKKVEPQLSS